MLQQPNLYSMEAPDGSAEPPATSAGIQAAQRPVWLRRSSCSYGLRFGSTWACWWSLPWLHQWVDNRFFNFWPQLASLAANGAVRGVVSGLGLLNIWIAISDAIHYRDSEL